MGEVDLAVREVAPDAAADAQPVAVQHLRGEQRRQVWIAAQVEDALLLLWVVDHKVIVPAEDGLRLAGEAVLRAEFAHDTEPGLLDELIEPGGG
jgi:hypothetical protein